MAVLVAIGYGVAAVTFAAVASAHATLLFSTPTANSAVATSPSQIQLVFDEPVTLRGAPIYLTDEHGQRWLVGASRQSNGGRVLEVPVEQHLSAGTYAVTWQVVAADGDFVTDDFQFAVGSLSGLHWASTNQPQTPLTGWLWRWALFLGLSLAGGGAIGARLVRRCGSEATAAPEPLLRTGLALGLLGALGSAIALVGIGDPQLSLLWATPPGRLNLFEVVVLAAALALSVARPWPLIGAVAGLAIALLEGWRAHPHEYGGLLGGAATTIHLAVGAAWLGLLVHVVRVVVASRQAGTGSLRVVTAYARLAFWMVATVVVTGVVETLILVPWSSLPDGLGSTRYGWWLIIKVGLVAVVLLVAFAARRHLRQRNALQGTLVRVEAVLLVVILALSAVLTTLSPPVTATAALPFAPPPIGPTVGVGSRAGFIGVGFTASEGQLVVRLFAPDLTSQPGSQPAQGDYRLAVNLLAPGGRRPQPLLFRGCGDGCFVTAVSWQTGTTVLSADVRATAWGSGTAAASIRWPVVDETTALRTAVRAMEQTPILQIHETVSSNTNSLTSSGHVLTLSGRDFLATEPYGTARAASATLEGSDARSRTIALAYPAEGIYVLLVLGVDNRIEREQLTTPDEFVLRTFVYPASDVPVK